MTNAFFFCGLPANFKDLCKIYPPSINSLLKTENFNLYRQLLMVSYEELDDKWFEDKKEGQTPTPFEYLLTICSQDKRIEKLAIEAFNFFIHEPVSFLYDLKTICIGNLEEEIKKINSIHELRLLKEEDYFDFQNLLRESLGEKTVKPPNLNENSKIKRIKRLGRKRDKLAAKQHGLNFGDSLVAICCMGLGITPLNIGEMSKSAIQAIMEMYQNREKYDIDIRSLLAGANNKDKKIEYWIKNLE